MGNSLSIPNFSSKWEDKIKFPTWYIDNPSVNKRSEQKCMTDLTNIINCNLSINTRIKLFNTSIDACTFLKKQFLDRLIITCPGIYNVIFPLRAAEYTEMEENTIVENIFNEFIYVPVELFFENPHKANEIASTLCKDYYNKYNFSCDAYCNLTSASIHVIHNCIGDDFSGESKRSWERHLSLLFNAYIHLPQIENQYKNANNTSNTANTNTIVNTPNTANTGSCYNDLNIINIPECLSSSSASSISSQISYNSTSSSSLNSNKYVISSSPQIQSTFELHIAKKLPWVTWQNEMFSINNEVFDMEHKEIVYIVNSLYYHVISDSPFVIIHKTTQVLSIIVSIHLYDEEKIYHSCDYPDKQEHDMNHVAVSTHLEEIMNSLMNKESNKNEKLKLICNFLNEVLPFDEDSDRKLGNYIYQQYLLNGNISLPSEYPYCSSNDPVSNEGKVFTIDDNDRLTIPEPIEEAIKRSRNETINNSSSNDIVEEKGELSDLDISMPNKKRK